ncbi:AtuA-related protein [Psychrobacillus lasiicapitis]|uniref:AtuA-like ferredoxin-fold domain-containing protein n=1 Tax=Psychrobacillus lasiicapitis TaxID=1636719 RepID=A0A544T924_9BACI|nr:hypothetical protein [Psychrobacillus lasiicapitis]TQR13906.1 hypothetical protein FG382_09865 [Psychrobacillus lasiicapitis]GGA36522.1 hypothetical protein GCM10011384_27660 [Psychrobacillus lasiicapitis]
MKLYEIAHCRTGDKGNTITLSVIPYEKSDYEFLKERLTADVVKQHLKEIVEGEVKRFEVENIQALQFVCSQALATGVTTSLTLDTHGKSLSFALLELEIG